MTGAAPAAPAVDAVHGSTGPPVELGHRVASGVRWAFVDQVAQQVGRVAINVLLTRLATPGDFGLIGIGFVVTTISTFITDLGMGAALVHHRQLTRLHVRVATALTLLVGIPLALLTVATAPAVAAFFDEPRLAPVLMVLALNFPLRGLATIQRDLLRRELEFRSTMVAASVAVFVSGVAAVVVGFMGGGVWALVVYSVGESAVLLVAQAIRLRRHGLMVVWPAVRRREVRELLGFGASVSATKLLYYAQLNGDNLLVGKVLGPEPLGYYNLAYRLMLYPIEKVADVIGQVSLPAFASIQHDLDRMRRHYLRALQTVWLVCIPLSIGLAVAAPAIVPFVFGHRWLPAVACVQILALNGPRLATNRLNPPVFQAVGRPSRDLVLQLLGLVVYGTAFVVGVQHGIVGMALAYTVAGYLMFPPNQILVAASLELRSWRVLVEVAPILGATALMAVVAEVVRRLVEGRAHLALQVGAVVSVSVLAYGAGLAVTGGWPLLRRAVADVSRRRR